MVDTATTAWVNAVVAAGGTVSAGRQTLVDNLIVGLKADGIWSKLDRLWPFAAENTQSARTDLVTATTGSHAGSPTFAVDVGYTVTPGNHVDLNYNLGSGGQYTRNQAHMAAWNLVNAAVASTVLTDSPGSGIAFFPKYVDNNAYIRVNDPGGGNVPIGDPRGWLIGNRTTLGNVDVYQNAGVLLGSVGSPAAAVTGTPVLLYDGKAAAASFGGTLTATEAANYYNRLNTYMAGIGLLTQNWVDAVVAAGGSVSSGRRTIVDTLIKGLATDGIWTKLDRLWLFAAENSQSALIDLVGLTPVTPVNSPTFTPDVGYEGSTTPSYLETGYNFLSNGVNYGVNSAHISVWSAGSAAASNYTLGTSINGGLYVGVFPRLDVDNNTYIRVNDNPASGSIASSTDARGFFLGNRSSSTGREAYLNGASLGTYGSVTALSSLLNETIRFYLGKHAAASCGGSLTATEAANFYTRLNTYLTALAAPPVTLTASAGAYTITGTSVALRRGQVAAGGSYTITGTSASFKIGLTAAAGSYTITGAPAGLTVPNKLAAAAGSYTITGASAALRRGHVAASGSYTITGAAATFAIRQTAAAGAYTITGTAAVLLPSLSGTAAFSDKKDLVSAAGNVSWNYDPATDAWIAAVVAATGIGAGTVSNTRAGIVDILIRGLKTDGLFAKLDRLWIFAAENRKSALVDMIATQLATEVPTSINFTVDFGYLGLNGHLNTNYTPSTAGGNYTANSASFGFWSLTPDAYDRPVVASLASPAANLYPRNNLGNLNYNIQGSFAENVVNSDAAGFWVVNRDSSTLTKVYRNGSVFYGTGSATAGANPNQQFAVLGDTSGSNNWPGWSAACYFGSKLTATEQANLYTRLNDYMGMVGLVTPTPNNGTAAVSDQKDVVAAVGTVDWLGTGALLEGADTVAATGTVAVATVDGVAALLEAADTVAITGTAVTEGTAALQDIADTVSATGTVAFVPVTGTAALLESVDTVAASVTVFIVVTGTAALQETADTAAAVGNIINNGIGALLEGADTVAAVGTVTAAGVAVGAGTLIEGRDTVSATGAVTGEVIGVPPGGGAGAGAGGGRGAHPLYRRILLRRKRRKQRELEEASPPTLPIERELVPFVPQPSLLQGLVMPPDPVQQLLQNAIVLAVEAEQDDEDAIAVLLEVL